MTTTVLSRLSGVQAASSGAVPDTAAGSSTVRVTTNSFSSRFSALNFRPLPVARRFRFCTAVSLSTWTSTVPASVMPDRAWMVFVTGMGQASPTALTKILLM